MRTLLLILWLVGVALFSLLLFLALPFMMFREWIIKMIKRYETKG